jgi:hypothetical protein
MELPSFDPNDPVKFLIDLENLQKKIDEPKKKKILKFINSWMGKKNPEDKFKSFSAVKNIFLGEFPSDAETKKFLCKYFYVYNEDFNLDLEYDEKLFTKFNALYMLKLMLNTIKYDLKKEKIKKYKRYTIIDKK